MKYKKFYRLAEPKDFEDEYKRFSNTMPDSVMDAVFNGDQITLQLVQRQVEFSKGQMDTSAARNHIKAYEKFCRIYEEFKKLQFVYVEWE